MELDKKELEENLKRIEKLLESNPHDPKMLYDKGVILEKLGNYRSAYTAYSMAHTYDPEMVMASNKMTVIEPKLDELRRKEYESISEFLDREKIKNRELERGPSYKSVKIPHVTLKHIDRKGKTYNRHHTDTKTNFSNNKHNIWFYKRSIAISIIIALIFTSMLALNFALVNNPSNSEFLLGTYGFFADFMIILFISLIINWKNKWADLINAFVISALLGFIKLPKIIFIIQFLEIFFLLFSLLYISTLAGNVIKHEKYNKTERYISYTLKGILIVLSIIMVGGLVTNNATLGSLNSGFSYISNISVTSSTQTTYKPINSTWVNQFFEGVNSYRTSSKLSYCASLSTFAAARYKTMSANIQISHYGYQQTFDNFWPNGYSYGDYIYLGFGEEVLYPNEPSSSTTTCTDAVLCSTSYSTPENYTPSSFISDLITNAPLHWQELISDNYSYYGYYVKNGPSYSILGPDNGQYSCPTTEIPGPNINITQYFAQYGCTTEIGTGTWFVIELAPVCPIT